MPPSKRKPRPNRRPVKKIERPSIIGPDYMELLEGNLFGKDVSVILCGESHHDAIDITRKGGIIEAKEDWVEVNQVKLLGGDKDDKVAVRLEVEAKRSMPLVKAQEWSREYVKDNEIYGHIYLLWMIDPQPTKVPKGKPYIVETMLQDELDEDDAGEGWKFLYDAWDATKGTFPQYMEFLIEKSRSTSSATDNPATTTNSRNGSKLFEWEDLDVEARELNRRRLTDEEISAEDMDIIINTRKAKRKAENIWTWDDWYAHIQSLVPNNEGATSLDLILEASVPPWELGLHRPGGNEDVGSLNPPHASDWIRRVSEDEEDSVEDEHDPSSDGVGSYIDFIYRRFMNDMLADRDDTDNLKRQAANSWLHCIDSRDLGCQAACQTGPVKRAWMHLIDKEERDAILPIEGAEAQNGLPLELHSSGGFVKFLPYDQINPENKQLQQMRRDGLIEESESDSDDDDDDDDKGKEISYPSFEGFFGQTADFLYYNTNVKLSYSPFLACCVQSLDNWEHFFDEMFLGGTIDAAFSHLNIESNSGMIHVRSSIHKSWNEKSKSYTYSHRDDGEHYISYPFFPLLFYLVGKDSLPQRSWSSQQFHLLTAPTDEADTCDTDATLARNKARADFAGKVRQWTSKRIKHHEEDPKASDDPLCGGEWFEAYLRAAHREIYEDIDRSDLTVLLKKNNVKSLSSGRKHNIGKIQIPPSPVAFQEIVNHYKQDFAEGDDVVSPRIEVLAKIIIDISMSCLVDCTTILRLGQVVSRPSTGTKSIVVVYMGSSHTRAISVFLTQQLAFKKKSFAGQFDWEDDSVSHTLDLPEGFWNF